MFVSLTCIYCFVCRAFWGFADHFRGQADSLLASLDAAKQKQLMGEQPSNSSSTLSLNSLGRSGPCTPAHSEKTRPVGSASGASSQYGYVSDSSLLTVGMAVHVVQVVSMGVYLIVHYYLLAVQVVLVVSISNYLIAHKHL